MMTLFASENGYGFWKLGLKTGVEINIFGGLKWGEDLDNWVAQLPSPPTRFRSFHTDPWTIKRLTFRTDKAIPLKRIQIFFKLGAPAIDSQI